MKSNQVGVFHAKTHLSAMLDKVERGERFLITRRGQPIAELRPIEHERTPLTRGCGKNASYWMADDFNDTPADLADYL